MIDTLVASAPASTADEFVRRTMRETGCPRAVARMALRLIVRRHRPQMGRLHRYLARFTPADRAYWVEQALATERSTLASILIGEFAQQHSVGRVAPSTAPDLALVARARSSTPDGSRPRGLALLDAALSEMSAASPGAAAAIAAVSARPAGASPPVAAAAPAAAVASPPAAAPAAAAPADGAASHPAAAAASPAAAPAAAAPADGAASPPAAAAAAAPAAAASPAAAAAPVPAAPVPPAPAAAVPVSAAVVAFPPPVWRG